MTALPVVFCPDLTVSSYSGILDSFILTRLRSVLISKTFLINFLILHFVISLHISPIRISLIPGDKRGRCWYILSDPDAFISCFLGKELTCFLMRSGVLNPGRQYISQMWRNIPVVMTAQWHIRSHRFYTLPLFCCYRSFSRRCV